MSGRQVMTGTPTAPDPEAVYIWVVVISGTKAFTAAYGSLKNARSFVEREIGEGGVWNENSRGVVYRYDHPEGPDTGRVEMREIPDAEAIVLSDNALTA